MKPEDWISYQLGDLFTFKNGLNFNQSDRGEAIKIVGVADFKSRIKLTDTASLATVTVTDIVRESELLQDGDLLFVRSNGNKALIGRCLYFPQVFERLAFSGFTIRGRVERDKLSPDFASHLMRSKHVTNQIHENGEGTNITNLSQEVLNKILVEIPGIDEQRRITEVLDTWNSAIDLVEKSLQNCRIQKQALMQKLLTGEQRLRGFSLPWQEHRLGKLFVERAENGRGDLPLLSITREEGVIPRGAVGRKDTSNEDKSKYLRICTGDIGYNTMRMWQGVSALSSYEGIISPAYTVLIPSSKISGRFASYLFKHEQLISLFQRHSQGLVSDTWNLKYSHFSKIKVIVPDRKEQEAIATVLVLVDAQISIWERKLKILNNEKYVLMQDLLTGKRRVRFSVVQEAVSA
jgi:type I restriction enzyme S subunit